MNKNPVDKFFNSRKQFNNAIKNGTKKVVLEVQDSSFGESKYKTEKAYQASFDDITDFVKAAKIKTADKRAIDSVLFHGGNNDGISCAFVFWKYISSSGKNENPGILMKGIKPDFSTKNEVSKNLLRVDKHIIGRNVLVVDLSYNQTQGVSGEWYGTGTVPITQLDVYPEHKYELDGSFCMYNIINGGPDTVDPSCTQIIDISFVSVRPTRTESNETGKSNSEKYFEGQSNPLLFTNASATYPVFTNTGPTLIPNVYFIDNTDSLQFKLSGNYYTQDNSDNILGIDASGIACSKYIFDCSNSALVLDASVNTLGFDSIKLPTSIGNTVDTSNNDFRITVFNNDIGTGHNNTNCNNNNDNDNDTGAISMIPI